MNSYLIIGGSISEKEKQINQLLKPWKLKLEENHPDLLIINPCLSIGISKIRQLQKFLIHKPYQALKKAVIVWQAEKLTISAQNAFLKTLEEPPANCLFILIADYSEQLLATIISRCQQISLGINTKDNLDSDKINYYLNLINNLIKASPGQKLLLIEPHTKSRIEAIKFCQEIMMVLRKLLIKEEKIFNQSKDLKVEIENYKLGLILDNLQNAFKLLQANVNHKLVVETSVLSF